MLGSITGQSQNKIGQHQDLKLHDVTSHPDAISLKQQWQCPPRLVGRAGDKTEQVQHTHRNGIGLLTPTRVSSNMPDTTRSNAEDMTTLIPEETTASAECIGSGAARLLLLSPQRYSVEIPLPLRCLSTQHDHAARSVQDFDLESHYSCVQDQAQAMNRVLVELPLNGTQSCLYHIVTDFVGTLLSQVRLDLSNWYQVTANQDALHHILPTNLHNLARWARRSHSATNAHNMVDECTIYSFALMFNVSLQILSSTTRPQGHRVHNTCLTVNIIKTYTFHSADTWANGKLQRLSIVIILRAHHDDCNCIESRE